MTLHLVSLPHTQTTSRYLTCAYTQKVVKFCKMMSSRHRIVLYAGEENEAEGVEHVPLLSEAERAGWFGDGFDTVETPLEWDPRRPYWATMNERAVREIQPRAREGDLLLLIGGNCQQPIAQRLGPGVPAVEWGVGYTGVFAEFCAYESSAWMHHVYARQGIENGRAFDAVIPNFFEGGDFDAGLEREDYLLYIGRLIERKGPHVARMIAERTGRRLVLAGPGPHAFGEGPGVEYVGEVGVEARRELMGRAAAVIVPTLYLEPFGGVAVEAMLSGAPVVASDWGAFTETVTPEVGRRFHTLAEGAAAVEEVVGMDAAAIRAHALARFSLEAVAPLYDEWLSRLWSLWGDGWYS